MRNELEPISELNRPDSEVYVFTENHLYCSCKTVNEKLIILATSISPWLWRFSAIVMTNVEPFLRTTQFAWDEDVWRGQPDLGSYWR